MCDSLSQKEQNTSLLSDILRKYSLLEEQFQQVNLNYFKEYTLSQIKQLDRLVIINIDQLRQNIIPLEKNQSISDEIMKLISNKTNYCSQEFLNQIKEYLGKQDPLLSQFIFDKISFYKSKELNLIQEQVDHMIQLKSNEKYKNEIENSSKIQQFKQNCKQSRASSFNTQLNKYLVQTYPFMMNYQNIYQSQLVEYCFSEDTKSPKLTLISQTSLVNNSNERLLFGLVQQQLDLTKTTRFQFKIVNLKDWIGVGICFTKSIKDSQYVFKYDKIGYGYYQISSHGLCWSHSHTEQHHVKKSFQFTTGQIVCLEFNPIEKKLRFYNKSDNSKFVMDLQISKNEEIVPCVCLSPGDQVEIINKQEDLEELNFD